MVKVLCSLYLSLIIATGLLGCSDLPPPNDAQAMTIVQQYVRDSRGVIEVHEALGRVHVYYPARFNSVKTQRCRTIASDAYWCEFRLDFSTAEESSVQATISFRVALENDQYRGVVF